MVRIRSRPADAGRFCIGFVVVLVAGCGAPVVAARCTVGDRAGATLAATVTLTNRAPKPIVKTVVLITTEGAHPAGNRLFAFVARVAPGETRSVNGRVSDTYLYDFKNGFDRGKGCEIERAIFADGTDWEMPSPL